MTEPEILDIVESLVDARPFPARLSELVELFSRDREDYAGKEFKEMALRAEFLNPLLEELGWDPLNKRGSKYTEREVIQEAVVTIGGQTKAPDYALLVDGKRRLFIEAKRPSVNIEVDRAPAYQIRRYCWSADLPYGLVTDFEEFAIYDCRSIPSPSDSATVGRIAYFRYDQLEDNWSLLDGMFGKHNVEQGILELLASEAAPPQGTRAIDAAFLEEIRGWRRTLAADVAVRNPGLSSLDVNSSVQTLIDRIVFLRIAEARGLEFEGTLQHVAGADKCDLYSGLLEIFRRADDRYNSGLFHLHGQPGDPEVDALGLSLSVSDGVLRAIVSRLYFPEPYEFSVLPADILGRIYEQFLGEHITVNPDRTTTIELKPEYRKSGGVYYTPTTIVEFIVQDTLGLLLEGKSAADIKRDGFTVVDPASGSGSFLIAAYQYLLDWYRDQYAPMPINSKLYLETGLDGQVRLKTAERKRILLDHIFGVDIDPQAVEVTKLSLLLKVIDGETQLEFDVGRILPDLGDNILCGNSLIDTDFPMPFDQTPEERLVANPFSWTEAFPAVFAKGGFDAVIGNPPYLNVDATWGRKDVRAAYLKFRYDDIYTDKTDLLFYFLKKAVDICRGETGFIVSRSFLESHKAQKLRGWLAKNARIRSVLDFRHALVFPKVGINTAIVRFTKSTAVTRADFMRFIPRSLRAGYTPEYLRAPENLQTVSVPVVSLGGASWNFGSTDVQAILEKMDALGSPIGKLLHVGQGMQTGANAAFRYNGLQVRTRELERLGLAYERARNSDIHRYEIRHSGVFMLYLESYKSFDRLPDDLRAHLRAHETDLTKRAAFVRGNCEWWKYSWPLHREFFGRKRILCPYRADTNRFALDESKQFLGITDTTILYENGQPEDLRYLLGVLNTRLLTARFRFIGKLLGGGVLEYYENTVSKLPVPRVHPGDPHHDRIVSLVREIEQSISVRESSLIASEKRTAQDQIDLAELEVEDIVSELFQLTPFERDLLLSQLE